MLVHILTKKYLNVTCEEKRESKKMLLILK